MDYNLSNLSKSYKILLTLYNSSVEIKNYIYVIIFYYIFDLTNILNIFYKKFKNNKAI